MTTLQETKQPHEMKREQTMKQHKTSGVHSYKSMTGIFESIIDLAVHTKNTDGFTVIYSVAAAKS